MAIVTQHPDVRDFNLPSKITTYMARGVPVFAVVNPDTEGAEIVRESGAGWVADSSDLEAACERLAEVMDDEPALARASNAGIAFAAEHFEAGAVARTFERSLRGGRPSRTARALRMITPPPVGRRDRDSLIIRLRRAAMEGEGR